VGAQADEGFENGHTQGCAGLNSFSVIDSAIPYAVSLPNFEGVLRNYKRLIEEI
jgi:hypothetical protein